MKTIYYDNATPNQRDFIENCIKRDIRANQSSLVSELLSNETFNYDDIQNLYKHNVNDEEMQEIFSWYLLDDDWIKDKLIELGEPVLSNDYGNWWGRTCCGQAIVLDPTFWSIYQEGVRNHE